MKKRCFSKKLKTYIYFIVAYQIYFLRTLKVVLLNFKKSLSEKVKNCETDYFFLIVIEWSSQKYTLVKSFDSMTNQ